MSTASFSVGDRVLIIQMKGAEINTSNSIAFGSVVDYRNCGNYEFANILRFLTILFMSLLGFNKCKLVMAAAR